MNLRIADKVFPSMILVVLLLCSCKQTTPNVIIWKSYHTFMSKPMPSGICRYGLSGSRADELRTFEDSCKFYHVNDTIK